MTTQFEIIRVGKLRNHRLNGQVFGDIGDNPGDDDFIQSIRERGVLQPLIVSADFTIISGHRRRQGAIEAGLEEVPCIIRSDLSEQSDIDFAWFDTNRNREMTTEQKARWFKALEGIESERARKRLKTKQIQPPANLPEARNGEGEAEKTSSPQGEAAEIAAKQVGMSRKTAKAAAAVVDVIDAKEQEGDHETAEKLRETLNTKSVSAAKAQADEISGKRPSQGEREQDRSKVMEARSLVTKAVRKIDEVDGYPDQHTKTLAALELTTQSLDEWKESI